LKRRNGRKKISRKYLCRTFSKVFRKKGCTSKAGRGRGVTFKIAGLGGNPPRMICGSEGECIQVIGEGVSQADDWGWTSKGGRRKLYGERGLEGSGLSKKGLF